MVLAKKCAGINYPHFHTACNVFSSDQHTNFIFYFIYKPVSHTIYLEELVRERVSIRLFSLIIAGEIIFINDNALFYFMMAF